MIARCSKKRVLHLGIVAPSAVALLMAAGCGGGDTKVATGGDAQPAGNAEDNADTEAGGSGNNSADDSSGNTTPGHTGETGETGSTGDNTSDDGNGNNGDDGDDGNGENGDNGNGDDGNGDDGGDGDDGDNGDDGDDGDDGDTTTTDPHANVVVCGQNSDVRCELPDTICCQGLAAATCEPPGGCGSFTAAVHCDGPEDCGHDAPICCAVFSWTDGAGTYCQSTCEGTATSSIMCHTDADCAAPRTCQSCQPPGGPATRMCVEQCPF